MSYLVQGLNAFLQSAEGKIFVEGFIYEKELEISPDEYPCFNFAASESEPVIKRWQIRSCLVLSSRDAAGFIRACKVSVDLKQFISNQSGYEKEMRLSRRNISAAVSLCGNKLCEQPRRIVEIGLLQTPGLDGELAARKADESAWWFIDEAGEIRETEKRKISTLLDDILSKSAMTLAH